jgi:hypothetical protein
VSLEDGTRVVVIGDEAWAGDGDALESVPAAMVNPMLAAFDPSFMVAAFTAPGALVGAAEQGVEAKNGVQARHFRIAADSGIGAMASMPPGSTIDLWIHTELGILVALDVQGMEEGFRMDVTNVNDPTNVVNRPS